MKDHSIKLGNFIANTSYDELPKNVVDKTKLWIIDTLGVTLAAVNHPSINIMVDYVKNKCCRKESSIIGYNMMTDCADAALVNSTAAHALDFDDWHSGGTVHPGCIVVPTALALTEKYSLSGIDFLTAVVIGYEVMIRVGSGARAHAHNG